MAMVGSDTQVRLNMTQTNVTFTNLQPGTTDSIKGNAWDPDGNQGDDITIYQITRPPVPGAVQVLFTPSRSIELLRLYRMDNSTLRVYWCSSPGLYNYTADLYGTRSNYTCRATHGANGCDISEIPCGEVYTVVVAPLTQEGVKGHILPQKTLLGLLFWKHRGNGCRVSWDRLTQGIRNWGPLCPS
ncbi:fibronectin type III domain-containing protein 7-like [Cyprinus carpio]|uniref:Fibronectin type III domain-containing protein 7-like n=1 Tax=Cyprinus carpio TaxID=7962 RepID=A0A9Q9YQ27_CYPCA|nr:fibronectin type III domain-containing protein 7-like [Cyprinus carpio]